MVILRDWTAVWRTCALLALCVVVCVGCAGEERAEQTGAADDVDRSSPRATVASFLMAMNAVNAGKAEHLADAVACLNLDDSGAPGVARRLF